MCTLTTLCAARAGDDVSLRTGRGGTRWVSAAVRPRWGVLRRRVRGRGPSATHTTLRRHRRSDATVVHGLAPLCLCHHHIPVDATIDYDDGGEYSGHGVEVHDNVGTRAIAIVAPSSSSARWLGEYVRGEE